MPKTLLVEMDASIAQFQKTVSESAQRWAGARTPQSFSTVEQELQRRPYLDPPYGGFVIHLLRVSQRAQASKGSPRFARRLCRP
jgi:hypothetical protein